MARTRQRHRMVHGRMQAVAALGVLAGMLSTAHPATAAGSSGSIRIGGHVPPHASIRLSNWTITPMGPPRSATRLRLGLANLSILANNRAFTVSLMSAAARGGRPGLLNASTGSMVPYAVSYDGVELDASDGEIPLDRLLGSATEGSDLEVRLRPGARLGAGRYQDRLVLVIKAR